MDRWVGVYRDRWTDGCMGGQVDGWMDGLTDENKQTKKQKFYGTIPMFTKYTFSILAHFYFFIV